MLARSFRAVSMVEFGTPSVFRRCISPRLCETTAVDGSLGRSLSLPRPPRHARTSRQQALTASSKFGRAMPCRRSRATCRKQSISCSSMERKSEPARACAARASIATRCTARGRQRRPVPGVPRPRPDGCPLLRGHTPCAGTALARHVDRLPNRRAHSTFSVKP